MEKLKREFNSVFPVRAIAYSEKSLLLPFQQIPNLLQVCIRLNGDVPTMCNIIDGVRYENKFPQVIIKMPGAECRTSPRINAELFYFTYFSDLCNQFNACGMLPRCPVWDMEMNPAITHLIRLLTQMLEHSNEYGVSDRIDQLAFQLFQELLLAKDTHMKNPSVEPKIMQLASFLQVHFNEDIDYGCLARKYGFSRRSLFRHWKNYFDKTPAEYVFDLKMREAERLLTETEKDVWEITQALNYQGSAYFCAAFKKHSGLTPLQYRKRT